jgi:two-component system NarL family sensor kinase
MKTEVEVVMILGFILMLAITSFVVLFILRYRQKQREHILEKQKMESKFKEDVMQIKVEISEQLLQKLSMEIHDNVCQSLTLAKIQLSMLDSSSLQDTRENGIELIGRALNDLRQMAYSMKGISFHDSGILKAIEKESEWIIIPEKRIVSTKWHVPFPEIPHDKQLILYRSVQELLNNCAKHSEATLVELSFYEEKKNFVLEVCDNGKGIQKDSGGGMGLANIIERMTMIGGTAIFSNREGVGTCVKLIFT